ncbi:MAG: glucose-1-phosphate cytidylyltransferase [Prevotella sp.]|jgi:glucose-1-phosphate cytidylyltransferase|nr:glucose-1-phosphate cytidylyltransferase [Prevotella sp.]MCI2080471.1 glucose-1-phosphate cytidylyltransferase [Prevotella sp.]MCI2102295.1 glucose-1-phosphate cytidylyltransferase [Prevotella sp.]
MKTVILAGGFGTRLSEYTKLVPKPMVEIGGKPILWHIMNHYAHYGYKDFVIALGYKGEVIKNFFLQYYALNNDFTIDLKNNHIEYINERPLDWKVTLVDTGPASLTGGRIKRLKDIIGKEDFMVTYGDAVSNVNIAALVEKFKKSGKKAIVTAVHPTARFGEIQINAQDFVTDFKEKPQVNQGWINGGFFVLKPDVFDYIEGDQTTFEREPLERLAQEGELISYRHEGFWQCMDTVRDRDYLNALWDQGNAPWRDEA